MHRFASSEGYVAESNLVSTLRTIRRHQARHSFDRVVIGVVTNSDDRVPSILSSFGLRVSPLRYGSGESVISSKEEYDIDFHCMSYDVGYEKPDRRIFAAAEDMLGRVVAADGQSMSAVERESWQKVYVGDEYAKDVVGAADAGWNPVLLDVEGSSDVCSLEDCSHGGLEDVFAEHAVVRVRSLHGLAAWLTGREE
jgi:FMN phosphatase YigB (HAD superfamily)